MIIGINATKSAVYLAETNGDIDDFAIGAARRITISLSSPAQVVDLLDQFGTLFNSLTADDTIAVVKCMPGPRGSSVEAIKAETAVEIAGSRKQVEIVEIAPQSLRKLLGGTTADKWQDLARDMFNADGQHQYWTQGMNGAVAVAYAAGRQRGA